MSRRRKRKFSKSSITLTGGAGIPAVWTIVRLMALMVATLMAPLTMPVIVFLMGPIMSSNARLDIPREFTSTAVSATGAGTMAYIITEEFFDEATGLLIVEFRSKAIFFATASEDMSACDRHNRMTQSIFLNPLI
jgi:hypothetical protein